MADTKLSALAAVTTVDDTDEYLVARLGASKKITGANLKAGAASGLVATTRSLTAGAGLGGGGDLSADRSFAVNVDDSTIEINSDTLRVKDGGITTAKLSFDPATQTELDAHINDTSDAHDASAISVADAGGYFTGTDVEAALQEVGGGLLVANTQTGTTYTLVLGDAGKLVTLSNASGITLTVPTNASVAYPVGTSILLAQLGAGQVTVAASGGVTVNARGSATKIAGQYGAATLIKTASDTWLLTGDITT